MGVSSDNDPFFADLGSGVAQSFRDKPLGEIRGYRVIGHAYSQQARAGSKNPTENSESPDFMIQNRQFVLVLGIKPFATTEEAQHWLSSKDEKPDP